MESSSQVMFNLDRFFYHSNNYEWTSEMPFFWFCFFKIDGSNCKLNESLNLEGKASLFTPLDKIENLNNYESDKGDFISIPSSIGEKGISLKPIPVPEFIKESTLKKPEPQAGCIVIFMNKNCFLADPENKFPSLLTATIQHQLDELIPTLNHKKFSLANKTKSLAKALETVITDKCQKRQPFWKKFISENRADATVWKFTLGELEELNSVSLTKNWTNEGTWELSGSISLEKGYPYPTFSKKNTSSQKRRKPSYTPE